MTPEPASPDPFLRLEPLDTPLAALAVFGYRSPGIDRLRPAAVLIGIDQEYPHGVWLTLRSKQMREHPGQVAFPGGRRESGDESPVATALRETHEETGIEPALVRPIGMLDRYDTITGYRITPVVAWVHPDRQPRPDGREVEQVFSVPLADVADPNRYRCDNIEYQGRTFEVLTLSHPDHHIWGATAALLHALGQRVG